MTSTITPHEALTECLSSCHPRAERLVDLAKWLTTEERKRREGKSSHWSQSAWVDPDPDNVLGLGTDQPARFSCGTVACAAGHIALEDGGQPVVDTDGSDDPDDWWVSDSRMFFPEIEEEQDIWVYAARALGLPTDSSPPLFHAHNNWSDMMTYIADYLDVPKSVLVLAVGGTDLPDEDDED